MQLKKQARPYAVTTHLFYNMPFMKNFILCFFLLFYRIGLQAQTVSDFIRIDQFGYRPNSAKVAVIVKPQTGFDVAAAAGFTPSTAANQYQLRKTSDNAAVFTGTLTPWKNGETQATSGDKAWWFDFSPVTTPGSYYVFDITNNLKSFNFDIREDVYSDVLRVATRMFFYNRCGAEKKAEFAGTNYADAASFVNKDKFQDANARSETDRNNAATVRDLSGGWWDAGDYNKYVTFARSPMHQLLDAYDQNPAIWGDNNKIPESGNGIPDLLDELKWELDWLKKMQNADGSSLIKVGNVAGSDNLATLPPSTDTRPRYYYPGSCSSATITQAGILSHAALVFGKVTALKSYADDLKTRAIAAFAHYQSNPRSENCDNGNIQAGDADVDLATQDEMSVQAAVYLFALTGDNAYKTYVDANYKKVKAMTWWGPYSPEFGDALLYYTKLAAATPSVVNDIRTAKLGSAQSQDFYKFSQTADPYRAYMVESTYHWGSNIVKADYVCINYDMITYAIDPANETAYRLRAEELIHGFHGVNALNMVSLTNMSFYGAEKSANQIYHSWYKDGTDWDDALTSAKGGPAPGYVPGGPNKTYADGNNNCPFSPPCNQPAQKSYKDWNGIWPDASWSVTEPAIYYQAAYIKALSKFATLSATDLPLPDKTQKPNALEKKSEIPAENLTVYPNPGSETIFLKYLAMGNEKVTIQLTDLTGRVLKEKNEVFYGGKNTSQLIIKGLPSGIYLILFTTGNARAIRKIVINPTD